MSSFRFLLKSMHSRLSLFLMSLIFCRDAAAWRALASAAPQAPLCLCPVPGLPLSLHPELHAVLTGMGLSLCLLRTGLRFDYKQSCSFQTDRELNWG